MNNTGGIRNLILRSWSIRKNPNPPPTRGPPLLDAGRGDTRRRRVPARRKMMGGRGYPQRRAIAAWPARAGRAAPRVAAWSPPPRGCESAAYGALDRHRWLVSDDAALDE